jgi:hypothetical protein
VLRLLLLCGGALLVLPACRDSAYQAASRVDTVEAWQRFVQQHPSDDNADAARARLNELQFEAAQRAHSVVAYKRFLEAAPDSEQAPRARALLEAMRFNALRDAPTVLGVRQFLAEHPDGAHRAEADRLLAELELKSVGQLDDPAQLARLAAEHPEDPRGAEAAQRLDDTTFARASTAASLFAYLREFPAGGHRDEARVRLLGLELEALLFSGALEEARALARRSPLSPKVPGLEARFARAEAVAKLASSRDERVLRALPAHSLRAFDDVVKSLQAPDPLDRWQAAEELGSFVTVKAIAPLLEAVRSARVPLERQRAFESLQRVLRALPRPVAEFHVAALSEQLEPQANDAQLVLTLAVLLDLTGQLAPAAAQYQKAFDPAAPDPVVLRRWSEIRRERHQLFSAAVASRQLVTWSQGLLEAQEPLGPVTALAAARETCGLAEAVRYAAEVIHEAQAAHTDFPDDLVQFERAAVAAGALTQARLRDAELKVLEADARARRCDDRAVAERLEAGAQERLRALAELRQRPPKELPVLLGYLQESDPVPAVREAAR